MIEYCMPIPDPDFLQGNVAAVALTIPLDTARVRMILDDKMKSKSSAQIIAQIASDEGV